MCSVPSLCVSPMSEIVSKQPTFLGWVVWLAPIFWVVLSGFIDFYAIRGDGGLGSSPWAVLGFQLAPTLVGSLTLFFLPRKIVTRGKGLEIYYFARPSHLICWENVEGLSLNQSEVPGDARKVLQIRCKKGPGATIWDRVTNFDDLVQTISANTSVSIDNTTSVRRLANRIRKRFGTQESD